MASINKYFHKDGYNNQSGSFVERLHFEINQRGQVAEKFIEPAQSPNVVNNSLTIYVTPF